MSIRETIEKQRGLTTAMSLGIVVIAGFFICRNIFSGPDTVTEGAYFTTDDGQTVFTAPMGQFAPFDHGGKPAYRAWMFSTDEGKTKFVAYLERFTPSAKARLEAEMADFLAGKSHAPPNVGPGDTEVKKPGAGNPWISRSDFAVSTKITEVQVPTGAVAEPVSP
jgi:hypothetical protein